MTSIKDLVLYSNRIQEDLLLLIKKKKKRNTSPTLNPGCWSDPAGFVDAGAELICQVCGISHVGVPIPLVPSASYLPRTIGQRLVVSKLSLCDSEAAGNESA